MSDINKCEFYKLPKGRKVAYCYANCTANITKYNFCKNNPNCYYKQLQTEKEKAIKYLQMYYKAKAGLL